MKRTLKKNLFQKVFSSAVLGVLLIVGVTQWSLAGESLDSKTANAIQSARKKAGEIDQAIRTKVYVDQNGYRVGDEKNIIESLTALYFDQNQKLIKSKLIMSYPEEFDWAIRYYNEKGTAFYSLYHRTSAMNYAHAGERFLKENGKLLYIDFLEKNDEEGGKIVKHVRATAKDSNVNPKDFDKVLNVGDLAKEVKFLYKVNQVERPKNVIRLKVVKPGKGDRTVLTRNNISLLTTPGGNKNLKTLHVGAEIQILETNEKWSKVVYRHYPKDLVGYIKTPFLASVEVVEK